MIWWVLVAALLAVLAASRVAAVRRMLPGATPPALPGASPEAGAGFSELQVRLVGLDHAIAQVEASLQQMGPDVARACAMTAAQRRRALRAGDSVGPTGPGTEAFELLLRQIDEVSEEDRRDLADTGVHLGSIREALGRETPPELWQRELQQTLAFVRRGLQQASDRRYR